MERRVFENVERGKVWFVKETAILKPDIVNSTVSFGGQAAEYDRRIMFLAKTQPFHLVLHSAVEHSTVRPQIKTVEFGLEDLIQSAVDLCP